MAAVVKPRFARETTNMEDAAAAMRARSVPSFPVDPDILDNALADLEFARIFLDATDRYFDELNEWLRPDGFAANRALHSEVAKGQTIMREADDRIELAEGRLEIALKQAYAAGRSAPALAASDAFDAAVEAYRTAYLKGQGFYLLNIEADNSLSPENQTAWDALVDVTRDAALEVLLTPASSTAHLATKQEVIDCQEAVHWDTQDISDFTRQLIADAIVLAGGEA